MSLIDRKINSWSQSVSSLDDKPQMTAASLKAAFDSNSNELKDTLNSVIDDLTSTNAIKDIGASVDGLLGSTVLDVFLNIVTKLSERYTKTEANSQINTQTKDLVKSITFDEDTGIFTIIKKDGSQTQIDTALEKVPAKFELITQGTSVLLRITNIDGSTTQTDVTALMSGYTFNQSDSIAFSLSGSGNSKTVTASIRQAGVTKSMLAGDVVELLQSFESKAEEHSDSAQYYSQLAQDSALAAQASDLNAQSAENAAAQSADSAATSAQSASQSADNAAASAQSAKEYSGKPSIIQDGKWHIWNAQISSYEDTGMIAKGDKGDKGDAGNDATINGFNTVQIIQGDNIQLAQSGSQLTISAKGGSSGSGKRVSRFTIGTSANGWTSSDCDYLCDGTDDQEEINAAISALPESGGEITILDGTYNISAIININKSNVKLSGNGNATKLIRMYDNSDETIVGFISINDCSNCYITSLCLDGNNQAYSSVTNISLSVYGDNNIIENNNFCNCRSYAFVLNGKNNIVKSNTFTNNLNSFLGYSENSEIFCLNRISDNIFLNSLTGIIFESFSGNSISGNLFNDNQAGIVISNSSVNSVMENTCLFKSIDTKNAYTIKLESKSDYNLIALNLIAKKYDDTSIGTNNEFINNKYQ